MGEFITKYMRTYTHRHTRAHTPMGQKRTSQQEWSRSEDLVWFFPAVQFSRSDQSLTYWILSLLFSFPLIFMTKSGFCTFLHIFSHNYPDRICNTAYYMTHKSRLETVHLCILDFCSSSFCSLLFLFFFDQLLSSFK